MPITVDPNREYSWLFENVAWYLTDQSLEGTLPASAYMDNPLYQGDMLIPYFKNPDSENGMALRNYESLVIAETEVILTDLGDNYYYPSGYRTTPTTLYHNKVNLTDCVYFFQYLTSAGNIAGYTGTLPIKGVRDKASQSLSENTFLDELHYEKKDSEKKNHIVIYPKSKLVYAFGISGSLDTDKTGMVGYLRGDGSIRFNPDTRVIMPMGDYSGDVFGIYGIFIHDGVKTNGKKRFINAVWDYRMERGNRNRTQLYQYGIAYIPPWYDPQVQFRYVTYNTYPHTLYPFVSAAGNDVYANTVTFINTWLKDQAADFSYDCFIQGYRTGQIMGKPGRIAETARILPASGSGLPYDETSFLNGLICGYHSAGWY